MADPYEGLAPVEKLTANESVYRTLRDAITVGKLAPGTRLVHRKLAQQMGTSNIPIIDALRRLEGEGLLITHPGVGAHVRRWAPPEVEEIFLVRSMLEAAACRLFVKRATHADMALLEAYNQAYDAVAHAGSAEEWFAVDERLHLHIVRATRSRELIRLVENSGIILMTIRHTMLPPVVAAAWAAEEGLHAPLVGALQSRDPEAAEREIRTHIDRVGQRTLALLEEARHHRPES